MSHLNKLAQFDSTVAQIREGLLANEKDVEIAKVGDATVISATNTKPAPQPPLAEAATDVADASTDATAPIAEEVD